MQKEIMNNDNTQEVNNERRIEIHKQCVFCHQMKTVYMTEDEYEKYELHAAGVGLIQEMLPEIDKCDRELLKSGICGDCWKNMFGPAPWEQDEDGEDNNEEDNE